MTGLFLSFASAVLILEPRVYPADEIRELIKGRSDLIVRSADRAHPAVVSGGRRITGWTTGTDGVWRVTLPDVAAGRWNFSQLFVNGSRRYRPRVPAAGWFEGLEPTRVVTDRARSDFGVGGFVYGGDVLDPSWTNREDLEIQMVIQWNGARMRIREIDPDRREVVFRTPHPSVARHHGPNHRRFAVENVKEAFGAPGQWYLDRPTGVLAYMPLPGEEPEACEVEAPVSETLLDLEGVRNVTFRDVVFRLDNANTPTDRSEFSSQGEIGAGAAVNVRRSSGIVFEGCVFVNLGGWAISFDDRSADCRVSACLIADGGAGGVRIGSKERAGERIVVEDCEITELGRRHPGGPGIMAVQGAGCRFLRNHIHHLYYTGISVGWGWRVEENPLSHHNEIARNHIHDIGLRHLSDMGLVYLLCHQPGTRIHHNHLHDATHWDYGASGIYADECSAYLEIDHNFVRRASRVLHCNMVRGLDVHHNVLMDGDFTQWDFSNNVGVETNLVALHHNTFVWSCGRLARRGKSFKATAEQRAAMRTPFWSGADLHDNVYWRRDGVRAVFPAAFEDYDLDVLPKLTLEAFQRVSGEERGSSFRDPGPLDPGDVCGETGVSARAKHAEWKLAGMPRPFGDEELYVVYRQCEDVQLNDGISNVVAKLRAGRDVTIRFSGAASGKDGSYRPLVVAWLRQSFPAATVTVATDGSDGPADLVFVELASEEDVCASVAPGRIAANAEGVVRDIWRRDPQTDIVFAYAIGGVPVPTFRRGVLTREAAVYDAVAGRYRIPTIHPRVADGRLRAGAMEKLVFSGTAGEWAWDRPNLIRSTPFGRERD